MTDLERDKIESQRMARKCEPILKKLFLRVPNLFNDKNLIMHSVEGENKKVLEVLDYSCGIDYYMQNKDVAVGFSWRATNCPKPGFPFSGVYNTFSLRKKRGKPNSEEHCEIKKRLDAIKYDTDFPKYMAQVHYDKISDTILSVAIAKTEDVFDAYCKGFWRDSKYKEKESDVWFQEVFWELMKENGYKVYEWYRDDYCKISKFLDEWRQEHE